MAISDNVAGDIAYNVAKKTNMNSLRMTRPRIDKSVTSPKFTPPYIDAADRAMFNQATIAQQQAAQRSQQQQAQDAMAQTQWMRYRNPQTAIQDMLQPGVLEALGGKLPINFSPEGPLSGGSTAAPGSQIFEPVDQIVLPPLGKTPDGKVGFLKADDIRHELWHYVAQNAGKLPNNIRNTIPWQNRFVESKAGAFISELLGTRQRISESAAISFGGAGAYPGYIPTFDPMEFLSIFNPNVPSWNYGVGK